jgi:hypothetical protein
LGTNADLLNRNATDAEVDALGSRAGAFFNSLHAAFDVTFAEFSDRDAGFKLYHDGAPRAWWYAAGFAWMSRFLTWFSGLARTRIVLWQIPLGNTKMRAVNNTWYHYQDNKVEWFFDDPGRATLSSYARAGVIAYLFGPGGAGTTCACDAARDGVTNPAPIGSNTRESLSADDDGGYFRERAAAYYAAGPIPLP